MRTKTMLVAGALMAAASAAAALAAGGGPAMGPAGTIAQKSFTGFYDGHHVTYLNTDVSSKAEAAAMHINYSARIGTVKGLPEIYLVQGKAAAGQLAVFGSEPGESNYSPLWDETILHWKAGATPVVITSDTMINKLEKQGKLTEKPGGAVLNCPIVKVSK
jgi:ABC-type oligopeptide transport system substrate-binding subunit